MDRCVASGARSGHPVLDILCKNLVISIGNIEPLVFDEEYTVAFSVWPVRKLESGTHSIGIPLFETR